MNCEYGCNQGAKYQQRNGKWCCSIRPNSCLAVRKRNSDSKKLPGGTRSHFSTYNKERVPCRFCDCLIGRANIKKHELTCFDNPVNLRTCPICKGPIRDRKTTTCSHACSNRYFRVGAGNGNYVGINGKHPATSYRRACFQKHPKKCVICDEVNIVEVHHFDGNHKNNDVSNLVPLCPTHHQYVHSRYYSKIGERIKEFLTTQ